MAYKFIDNYREKGARKRLVEILEKKGIEDRQILKAIGKVPRHFFFDETFWNQAYKDIAFPIVEGRAGARPGAGAGRARGRRGGGGGGGRGGGAGAGGRAGGL